MSLTVSATVTAPPQPYAYSGQPIPFSSVSSLNASVTAAAASAAAAAAFTPYADRATAEAANPPAVALRIAYFGADGNTIAFKDDPTGNALTTADARTWSPDGIASLEHWNVPATGAETLMATAMQWCVDNSVKLVDSGTYETSNQVNVTYLGDLDFDFTGATFTASNTFPGSATRMFNITGGTGDETVFQWVGGKVIAGNMPAEGTLSSNDVFNISISDSATRCVMRNIYIDMSDGINADYRRGGGDTGMLVNAYDIHLENITVVGADDLGIYATATPNQAIDPRQARLFATGIVGIGCRNGAIQAKRDFRDIYIDCYARDCLYGTGFGPTADENGDTFTVGSENGHVRIVTDNVAYPVRTQRVNGITFHVAARNLGLYLPEDLATGAGENAIDAGAGFLIEGSTGCICTGTIQEVNPDLITALGGGYIPGNFAGCRVEDHTGVGLGIGPIASSGNTFRLNLTNIPRPINEVLGNLNVFDVHATGNSVNPVVAATSSLTLRDGISFVLASNNNSGTAGNQFVLRDLDGSSGTDQPMGRIVGQNNDGGTIDEAAALELREQGLTGAGQAWLQAGGRGALKDVLGALQNGNIALPNPKAPATATDTGIAGEWSWDASFIYICVAANTWKRVGIATW